MTSFIRVAGIGVGVALLLSHIFLSSLPLCSAVRSLPSAAAAGHSTQSPSVSSFQTLKELQIEMKKPISQSDESLRRIPPSTSNPTQNRLKQQQFGRGRRISHSNKN